MIDLRRGRGILELVVSRRVTESDIEVMKRQFERQPSDGAAALVLCSLNEFWGFDSQALWDDFRHWLRYLNRPARVALLAEPKWIDLCERSPFEPSSGLELCGFEPEREADARRWLRLEPVTSPEDPPPVAPATEPVPHGGGAAADPAGPPVSMSGSAFRARPAPR